MKEIILDDSQPYVAQFPPDQDTSVMEVYTDRPPVSPPRLELSNPIDINSMTFPPHSNKNSAGLRDENILLLELENQLDKPVNLPKIKIANNLFSSPSEQLAAPLMSPQLMSPPTKRYPTVQRSPSSSP